MTACSCCAPTLHCATRSSAAPFPTHKLLPPALMCIHALADLSAVPGQAVGIKNYLSQPTSYAQLVTKGSTCAQVVAFADALKSNTGAPLVRAAHVSSQLPLPRQLPDIVAATPAALMAATGEYGQYAGWEWTKEGIVARCAAAVLPVDVHGGLPSHDHPLA